MSDDARKLRGTRRAAHEQEETPAPAPKKMEQILDEGPVRRIVFEDEQKTYRPVTPVREPEPEPPVAPEPEPKRVDPIDALPARRYRGRWTIDEIHREIDRLNRSRVWGLPSEYHRVSHSGTIYRTGTGSVREAHYVDGRGDRRLLYVSRGEGALREEQRFVSSMVDRVIKDVHGAYRPPSERLLERAIKEPTGTTNGVGAGETEAVPARKAARRGAKAKKPKAAASKRKTSPKEDGASQPQCAALTADGLQCRNSSRRNSKYCGSHRTYRPRGTTAAMQAIDTKPRSRKAADTEPTVRKTRGVRAGKKGGTKAGKKPAKKSGKK